jgi:hypothetical protein
LQRQDLNLATLDIVLARCDGSLMLLHEEEKREVEADDEKAKTSD